MTSNKLHPIYVALDAHQYSRAIKLAVALPDSNILGKALLAHAYSKSGQRYHALTTLQSILTFCYTSTNNKSTNSVSLQKQYFWELQHEIQYSLQARQEQQLLHQQQQQQSQQQQTQQQTQQQQSSASSKKGKKGKKKPNKPSGGSTNSTTNTNAATNVTELTNTSTSLSSSQPWDLIDQLNTPPTVPDQWEVLPPAECAIIDETTLATLAVTLQSLKLPLTAYQLYSWAISAGSNAPLGLDTSILETYLTKTFCLGLNVLAYPSKYTSSSQQLVWAHVLSHLQSIALQWARLVATTATTSSGNNASTSSSPILLLTTAWAAQTSMWQLQWLPHDPKREMILPRLAESMANRLVEQHQALAALENTNDDGNSSSDADAAASSSSSPSLSAEIYLLKLRTLEYQSKWTEMLQLLETLEASSSSASASISVQAEANIVHDTTTTTTITSCEELFGIALTPQQIMTETARVLTKIEQYGKAQDVYEKLLESHPDDWTCWKHHLNCGLLEKGTSEEKSEASTLGIHRTEAYLQKVLELHEDSSSNNAGPGGMNPNVKKYPLRGPHLMKLELAAQRIRQKHSGGGSTDILLEALVDEIKSYSARFAPRASCTFSDVREYVDLVIHQHTHSSWKVIESFLQWAETMRRDCKPDQVAANETGTPTEMDSRSKLRSFIFATRMTHHVVSLLNLNCKSDVAVDSFLPNLKDLITVWKSSLSSFREDTGEQSQKETRPGDDLILLAVQQLLYQNSGSPDAWVTAAVLLETAINHSPHSAYLKIAAIDVYYQLNAMSRSWEFFQAIGLKHIQLDSCTYTVLPLLVSGGLYNETIEVCNAMLRFQAGTARDCGEYAGRAMEGGTLTKANEFLLFQRKRMNKSLTILQAKGLILDSAAVLANVVGKQSNRKRVQQHDHESDPILQGGLGVHQGIVGGESDMGRATQMVVEAYNPYAALSLVSWADASSSISQGEPDVTDKVEGNDNRKNSSEGFYDFADNRDLAILDYQILKKSIKPETEEKIVLDSLRRGHLHGLLIRATLCVDATKGPKKGKIVKPTEELEKRTTSALESVQATQTFIEKNPNALEVLALDINEKNAAPHSSQVSLNEALLYSTLDLCRVLAAICAGQTRPSNDTNARDTLEWREQVATDLLQAKATILKEIRQAVLATATHGKDDKNDSGQGAHFSIKQVCLLLPNTLVPLFAVFRMCATVTALFGWGKRKRYTKRCAGAMADLASEFSSLLDLFIDSVNSNLHESGTSFGSNDASNETGVSVSNPSVLRIIEDFQDLLDENMVRETVALINQAQYRTRLRVEPILVEMKDYLNSFDVAGD